MRHDGRMKLLTTDGSLSDVSARSWPMAGLDSPAWGWQTGQSTLSLVPTPSGELLTATYANLYRQNPWVHACVNVIASGVSRLPMKVYRLNEHGDRERVRHDLPGQVGRPTSAQVMARLLKRPNPEESGASMMYATMVDRLVYGNALWYVERGDDGFPTELWRVPWQRVRVVEGDQLPIVAYEVEGDRNTRRLLPDDVIHFGRGTDPTRPLGISPMEPLAVSLKMQDAIARHLVAYFKNQARPSANLKLAPGADRESIREVVKQVTKMYTAPESAGKVVVTTGDWQPVGADPEHAQVVELAKHGREEVCAVYNVPPPLVGILDRAIMSNVRELTEWYVRNTLGPHASAIEDELMAQLVSRLPSMQGTFLEFDLAEQLRPDLEARARSYQQMSGVMTTNEMRSLENLPPLDVPEADTVMAMPGAVPLGFDAVGASGVPVEPAGSPDDTLGDGPDEQEDGSF